MNFEEDPLVTQRIESRGSEDTNCASQLFDSARIDQSVSSRPSGSRETLSNLSYLDIPPLMQGVNDNNHSTDCASPGSRLPKSSAFDKGSSPSEPKTDGPTSEPRPADNPTPAPRPAGNPTDNWLSSLKTTDNPVRSTAMKDINRVSEKIDNDEIINFADPGDQLAHHSSRDIAKMVAKDGSLTPAAKDEIERIFGEAGKLGCTDQLVKKVNERLEKAGSNVRMIHDDRNPYFKSVMLADKNTGKVLDGTTFNPRFDDIPSIRSDYPPPRRYGK